MTPSIRPWSGLAIAAGSLLFNGCDSLPPPAAGQSLPVVSAFAGATADSLAAEPLDPSLLLPGKMAFRLGPGDRVDIEVVGDASTRTSVTVGPDGKIYYYLLPGLDVWGLTLPEARDRLGAELNRFLRERPVVSVTLRTVASQSVWVLGRVGSPGVYTLGGPTTLLDALAQAGGLSSSSALASFAAGIGLSLPAGSGSESADLSRSFLIRKGRLVPVDFQRLLEEGDLSQNVYLQPDDFIFLPSTRSAQVHVLGAVLQPHSERMAGSLTLIQAIALAGGTEPEACLSNVAILRGSLAHPQIAVVQVDAILRGKAPDVRLEANDIVYVPNSPNTILARYVNLILDTFVRTVGVNEGAYAITGKSTPVGVGVSVTP
jgi:protein involved in polysaccharide export with SLBB domain